MLAWVKAETDAWTSASGVAADHVFRPVKRNGCVTGEAPRRKRSSGRCSALSGRGLRSPESRPTISDAVRTVPVPGGELEQIQLLLGHACVQTTERYLGTRQDLVHAPNDAISLRLAEKQS